MISVIIVAFIIGYALSPFFRCFLKNIHNSFYYAVLDIIKYFKLKEWEKFGYFGIDMFVNMFAHGKTLSMTHRATQIYKRYGDSIRFISNYHLTNIPYIPLVNFNQLVDLGTDDSDYVGTVVLIDEISTVLSHRNFANFPIEMLSMLLQQRKRHIYIMCTAQRFFMVDKIWRSITTNVFSCDMIWRFVRWQSFDAWDYENAVNSEILKPRFNYWWFVHNSDFDAYDTSEMITKQSAEDFISNEESIVRKGLDSSVVSSDNVPIKHKRKKYILRTKK